MNEIIVVGSQWYGHFPIWAGIEKKIFQNHGFLVEWRIIDSSMDRLLAISSGKAHFASLGEIAMLEAMAQGIKGFYWVGNQDIAPGHEGLVVASGIHSYESLRNKKIGLPFGTSVDLTCRMLLKQNGLSPGKDVELVDFNPKDVVKAFKDGSIDAALIWEPGFSELRSVKGATVLDRDIATEVYKKFKTMTGPDVLIISKSWVDSDSSRAKEFLRAYFESLTWVKENMNQAIQLVSEKYIQQRKDLIARNMECFIWNDLNAQKSIMTDKGILGQVKHIIKILHEEMKFIPKEPEFIDWVKLDILPFEDNE